jgi:hypothetical protein
LKKATDNVEAYEDYLRAKKITLVTKELKPLLNAIQKKIQPFLWRGRSWQVLIPKYHFETKLKNLTTYRKSLDAAMTAVAIGVRSDPKHT